MNGIDPTRKEDLDIFFRYSCFLMAVRQEFNNRMQGVSRIMWITVVARKQNNRKRNSACRIDVRAFSARGFNNIRHG